MPEAVSLARSIGRGLAAGLAGTAAMTGVQLAARKARGERLDTPVPRTWAEAPAPAQVAKRAAEAVGRGRQVTKRHVPLLANGMHWLYGAAWGAGYGALAHTLRPDPLTAGPLFGVGVWAAAYGELVPLGIYEPPWRYPASELALDLAYHLVYGVAVAGSFAALER
jgi:hypothetical protein